MSFIKLRMLIKYLNTYQHKKTNALEIKVKFWESDSCSKKFFFLLHISDVVVENSLKHIQYSIFGVLYQKHNFLLKCLLLILRTFFWNKTKSILRSIFLTVTWHIFFELFYVDLEVHWSWRKIKIWSYLKVT